MDIQTTETINKVIKFLAGNHNFIRTIILEPRLLVKFSRP